MQQAKSKEASEDIGNGHGGPEKAQTDGEFMVFVEVGEVENDLDNSLRIKFPGLGLIPTSGINPPCKIPSNARHVRNDDRPDSQNWQQATIDHSTICAGIHRSGPIHLLISCEGSSEQRKASLKTVLPRL